MKAQFLSDTCQLLAHRVKSSLVYSCAMCFTYRLGLCFICCPIYSFAWLFLIGMMTLWMLWLWFFFSLMSSVPITGPETWCLLICFKLYLIKLKEKLIMFHVYKIRWLWEVNLIRKIIYRDKFDIIFQYILGDKFNKTTQRLYLIIMYRVEDTKLYSILVWRCSSEFHPQQGRIKCWGICVNKLLSVKCLL